MSASNYTLGFITNTNGTRLEVNSSDIDYIVQFFLSNNFITNIQPIYVDVDFENETNDQIDTKLSNYSDVKVWITAVNGEHMLRLNDSYFILNKNRNILLISVCDEETSLLNQKNILHISNLRENSSVQTEKTIFNAMLVSGTYNTVYVFYDDSHSRHKEIFEIEFNKDNIQDTYTAIYCNKNNYGEFAQTITKIINDVSSGLLTVDNTMFLYFCETYETYFNIFSLVEDPVLLGDPEVQISNRHFIYYTAYLNVDYLGILANMKTSLVPKFISDPTNVSEFEIFFNNKLRATVLGQGLTKQQSQKLSYLNYVYYVRTPVDNSFLENHRITIYTILLEKAITLAKEILYRELPTLDLLYSSSVYTDGRMFGPFNFDVTGSQADLGYFNQLHMLTYELDTLYYIKEPKLMVRDARRARSKYTFSTSISNVSFF